MDGDLGVHPGARVVAAVLGDHDVTQDAFLRFGLRQGELQRNENLVRFLAAHVAKPLFARLVHLGGVREPVAHAQFRDDLPPPRALPPAILLCCCRWVPWRPAGPRARPPRRHPSCRRSRFHRRRPRLPPQPAPLRPLRAPRCPQPIGCYHRCCTGSSATARTHVRADVQRLAHLGRPHCSC